MPKSVPVVSPTNFKVELRKPWSNPEPLATRLENSCQLPYLELEAHRYCTLMSAIKIRNILVSPGSVTQEHYCRQVTGVSKASLEVSTSGFSEPRPEKSCARPAADGGIFNKTQPAARFQQTQAAGNVPWGNTQETVSRHDLNTLAKL